MELCKRVIFQFLLLFSLFAEEFPITPLDDTAPAQSKAFEDVIQAPETKLKPPSLDQETTSRILYYLQRGFSDQAILTYLNHYNDCHDYEIIQAISMGVLKEGFNSKDPESQLMAVFGAGIALNEKLLGMLEQGVNSAIPEIQLASLNFLAQYQNDEADRAIHSAMASDFLIVRLEAALILAEKKHPAVVAQTEALIQKVPKQIHPLFPQLFALVGTDDAIKVLKKMLASHNQDVRIEAIRSIAKEGRDDLLDKVRRQASHHNPSQQEVCAYALGTMKDESSIPRLEKLAKGNTPAICLAALKALWQLGRKEVTAEIEVFAKERNVFAIQLLGSMPEAQQTLFELTKHPNLQIKFNAALALLEQQDSRCLPFLCELLLKDAKDLGLTKISSLGATLSAYKIIPSSTENFKEDPQGKEFSLHLKEKILTHAIALPEQDFLNLACTLFESHQNPLIPTLVHLLEKLQTPASIHLLKTYQQKAGAPLIRNYCNLALYRLKEKGPYLDNLKKWVAQEQSNELIRFRPISARAQSDLTTHQLTPEETSRLLIEVFEALARMQEKESLDIILDAIRSGNKKNKFALAGLLIRAAQ